MRHGALMQAAEEVLQDIFLRHRPANLALADWGRSHRFAGAKDRSAIGTLVFDVLRSKSSLAARMGDDAPRPLVLAAASGALGLSNEAVAKAAADGVHAIGALNENERAGLDRQLPPDAPDDVKADIPAWLLPSLGQVFGDGVVAQGRALAARAPIDLRANTLKGNRQRVMQALSNFRPALTPHAPDGVRLPPPAAGIKAPNVEREAAHGKGWFEVQDEGSQLAALLTGAGPRMQVLDLCAGAGGKTLALAATMQNSGQLFAYDKDKSQLRPIFDRLRRAGVRNVQVLEAGDEQPLVDLEQRFDIVLVDAPCSGSGTWRRRPDSKWRLSSENLQQRQADQQTVLARAARIVRPGGRLVYVTCSLLPEENNLQVEKFVRQHTDYSLQSNAELWQLAMGDDEPLQSADGASSGLLLTPETHGTDGFYIASLRRAE